MRRLGLAALCLTTTSLALAGTAQTVRSPIFNMTGARTAALGEAFSAVGGDIDSVSINPAGMAAIDVPWIATSYRHGVTDDNWGYVHYAHPVSFGSLFAGVSYFDAGDIDITFLDAHQETRSAQKDFAGLVGAGFGKNGWLTGGASAKVFKMELAEEASATGYAADAGILAKTPVDGLTFGASAQNIGPDVKFEEESESLPQRFRYGGAYFFDFSQWESSYKIRTSLDGVSEKNENTAVHAGLEILHDLVMAEKEGWIALRGGYQSGINAFSAGLGIGIHSFSLDYAIRFHSSLDASHFATLGYRFGVPEHTGVSEKRLPSGEPAPSTRPRRHL